MTLDKLRVVDAVGTDKGTGDVILTVIDYWDWADEQGHLLALQEKLNTYFEFVEGGQLYKSYPDAVDRQIVIDVITRYDLPAAAQELLRKAAEIAAEIDVQIATRVVPG